MLPWFSCITILFFITIHHVLSQEVCFKPLGQDYAMCKSIEWSKHDSNCPDQSGVVNSSVCKSVFRYAQIELTPYNLWMAGRSRILFVLKHLPPVLSQKDLVKTFVREACLKSRAKFLGRISQIQSFYSLLLDLWPISSVFRYCKKVCKSISISYTQVRVLKAHSKV